MSIAESAYPKSGDGQLFTVQFVCRECGAVTRLEVTRALSELDCGQCHSRVPSHSVPELAQSRVLEACLVCGGQDFYVRKDFKQTVGVFAVTLACVIATVIYAYTRNMVWTVLVLVISSVIDSILFRFVPDLTACYRCKAEYRGMVRNPAHKPFSHYTAERYRALARTKA